MTIRAETGRGLSSGKNYQLYLNVLKAAWESEGQIDRSEALLLESLRFELGIWNREHLLLEHHPNVRKLWDTQSAYVSARNQLLLTGLVLTFENNYVLADEVAKQILKVWGTDLKRTTYQRLLEAMKNEQLYYALEKTGLQVSGSKDERIQRLINALVPPSEFLDYLHIDDLREFCRQNGIQVSGRKSEVIGNIIDHFDQGLDVLEASDVKPEQLIPSQPEERELDNETFVRLLQNLTNDQLYDILSASYLRTSGSKEEKVKRLVESPWSEASILSRLRRIDLSNLCRRIGIQVSGVKTQLIDRVVEGAKTQLSEATAKALAEDQESQAEAIAISTAGPTTEITEMEDAGVQSKPPPGLIDVAATFTNLEPDEQMILALIKETKSLTEQDIERASRRHGLGWFLTRAHMAELVAKLTKTENNPLRVRSVRSVNIYEWIGEKQREEGVIEKRAARDVIDALRQGVVPEKNLEILAVGQVEIRSHLKNLLEEANAKKSPFKFIRGPYGAGKTFLCSWFREYAFQNEFAVATVNIGPDQPLSDLPVFFSGLIGGLRTPEKRDSSALADILESWLLGIHRKTAQLEGLKAFDPSTRKALAPIVEARVEAELAHLADLAPGFAQASRAFYHARSIGEPVRASTAVAWLSGSQTMSSGMLKEIGVKGRLEPSQVFPRMRALLDVIDGARYQGLLLLVDELELVRKFPHTRQREQALETLRLLIDESGKNGFPGCLLTFIGTDSFFEDDRAGLKSYEALAARVSVPAGPEGIVSMRQPVIELQGLNRNRLLAVVSRVRDIHGVAYSWSAKERLPNGAVEKLVSEWTSFGDSNVTRKPRPVLREFIHILDLCEENPGVTPSEFVRIPTDIRDTAREIGTTLER